jgi:hypothetical protein
MKIILKTMPPEFTLKYDEKFTSESNADILRQLIPRIIASMKPRFSPSYKQINDWLGALHKHRRARLLYVERGVIDKDNRRLHRNNRLSEVESVFYEIDTKHSLHFRKNRVFTVISKLILNIRYISEKNA